MATLGSKKNNTVLETTVAAPGQTCIRTMEGTFSLSFTFSIQFSLDNKYNSMSRSQINGKMKECIILFNNKLLSATKLWLNEKVFYPLEVFLLSFRNT